MDKQIVVDPYNRILYSVINRNELLIHAKTWMNLEITKLNKRGLTEVHIWYDYIYTECPKLGNL